MGISEIGGGRKNGSVNLRSSVALVWDPSVTQLAQRESNYIRQVRLAVTSSVSEGVSRRVVGARSSWGGS